MRAGEDITEPTDSPTASTAVSHAQEAPHSPLPWRVFDEDFANHHFPGIEAPEYSVVIWGHEHEQTGVRGRTAEEARDNAAFIVRACNHHEALLAALKALHDDIADYARINNLGGFDNHCMRQARAAIANVEGN